MLKVVVMQDPRVGFDWLDAVPILQSEAKVLIVKVGFDCFAFTIKTKRKKEIMSITNLGPFYFKTIQTFLNNALFLKTTKSLNYSQPKFFLEWQ